ncbi:1-deoxy-D-xylulose-5-phosphate synthase [Streptomyces sp. 184]|uniref:1-deoxy-D-xylulose-5-phosphate synthase n=1 Tax=Streptomyces sp. 184 TaxID=1827526 RepID=UPI0038922F24
MPLLDSIGGPGDLKALPPERLAELAGEIREFLVHAVARTGGHLGPNLGVVELTLALHRVFDSPADRILWDTGHQSYVHKLLTGRQDFAALRGRGGLSGYPSRAESEHDVIENSHASTVLGWADGLAKANEVRGSTPVVGRPLYDSLHGAKKGFEDAFAPQGMFEDLGLKYVGPVDGHDTAAVESALRRAKRFHGPVLVHCLTEKGRGYQPALDDEADHFHTVGVMDPLTCEPVAPATAPSWTSVFSDELVRIGAERDDVVAITAAMLHPTGLAAFAAAYPGRVWDVGIAEQHAAVSAAGLATGGLHPVVAVYATFLDRAFDQVLMDVALHRCGVTFVLDRAGVTGPDGASHHGMWDMSILQVVPGLRIAAPRDADQLRAQLREAVAVDDTPTVVRFPRGTVSEPIPATARIGGMDVLRRDEREDVLLVAAGAMAPVCLEAAGLLAGRGLGCTVVDPRWVKPVDAQLPPLADRFRVVAVAEDNSVGSGVGAAVARALRDAEVDVPLRTFGLPERFLPHGTRAEVLAEAGLTPARIAAAVGGVPAARAGEPARTRQREESTR